MEGKNDSSENGKNKINKLEASNQQLNASNQQLRATEQQLRAANQQLRASEQRIRESEAKYRTLIENIPQKIFMKDKNYKWVSINENFEKNRNPLSPPCPQAGHPYLLQNFR